jgi:hypothetical protein
MVFASLIAERNNRELMLNSPIARVHQHAATKKGEARIRR